MSETVTYNVRGIHCDNCKQRIEEKVSAVAGVESAEVDRERDLLLVRGENFSDSALRAAVEAAGYRAD